MSPGSAEGSPSPTVGSTLLPAIGNAVAVGAGAAVAPVVSVRQALPALPLVPAGVQLSVLTGTPNLGAGNQGNFNIGVVNKGNFNIGNNNTGNFNVGGDKEGAFNIGFNNIDDNAVPGASDLDNVAVAGVHYTV